MTTNQPNLNARLYRFLTRVRYHRSVCKHVAIQSGVYGWTRWGKPLLRQAWLVEATMTSSTTFSRARRTCRQGENDMSYVEQSLLAQESIQTISDHRYRKEVS